MDQLQLATFHQFAAEAVVSLGVDQVDVLTGIAEDVGDVDNAGGFLVLGELRFTGAKLRLATLELREKRADRALLLGHAAFCT